MLALSKTTIMRRSAIQSRNRSRCRASSPGTRSGGTPSLSRNRASTSDGGRAVPTDAPARSTNSTPSGNRSRSAYAHRTTAAVFPIPPAPVRTAIAGAPPTGSAPSSTSVIQAITSSRSVNAAVTGGSICGRDASGATAGTTRGASHPASRTHSATSRANSGDLRATSISRNAAAACSSSETGNVGSSCPPSPRARPSNPQSRSEVRRPISPPAPDNAPEATVPTAESTTPSNASTPESPNSPFPQCYRQDGTPEKNHYRAPTPTPHTPAAARHPPQRRHERTAQTCSGP